MKMLKNNYRLCSEGSLRELTGEMAYELWIFFSLKSLSSQSPKKFYIVHIEENENSFNYPPSVVHYLFIYFVQKKTPSFLVQPIECNYCMTSQNMCQNSILQIFALCDQYFEVSRSTTLSNEAMMKTLKRFCYLRYSNLWKEHVFFIWGNTYWPPTYLNILKIWGGQWNNIIKSWHC